MTSFWDRQDRARRMTRRLLALLAFWVGVVTVFTTLGLLLVTGAYETGLDSFFTFAALIYTVLVAMIGFGALVRRADLQRGGYGLMELVGGEFVLPDTDDPQERQLLHVVEEMAIASGMPVPGVFVLRDAYGLNAFAAGRELDDAALAVTADALEHFTREELQGVVAHEFSHLLNGDTILNIRVICCIHGLMCVHDFGRFFLGMRGRSRFAEESPFGGRRNPFAGIGLVLLVCGFVGAMVGRIIQAAINRQREHLADASAVQFTRYPEGLRHALMRIGGYPQGSWLGEGNFDEAGHCFIAEAKPFSSLNLFATHPPLDQRIEALGRVRLNPRPRAVGSGNVLDAVGAMAAVLPLAAAGSEATPRAEKGPLQAAASLTAMLLKPESDPLRIAQLKALEVAPQIRGEVLFQAKRLAPYSRAELLCHMDRQATYLYLLSQPQADALWQAVMAVIHADGLMEPFEAAVAVIFDRRLPREDIAVPPPRGDEACVLLSALAHASSGSADAAFRAGVVWVPRAYQGSGQLMKAEACHGQALFEALRRLAYVPKKAQRAVVEALMKVLLEDARVDGEEDSMMRVILGALGCPYPRELTPVRDEAAP
jgi:Zn-dependent protease with chaperone function